MGIRLLVIAITFCIAVFLHVVNIHSGILVARQETEKVHAASVALLSSPSSGGGMSDVLAAQEYQQSNFLIQPPEFSDARSHTQNRTASVEEKVAETADGAITETPRFTFWSRARVVRQHELSVAIQHDNRMLEAVSADFRQCRGRDDPATANRTEHLDLCPFSSHDMTNSSDSKANPLVVFVNSSDDDQGETSYLLKNIFAVTRNCKENKQGYLILYEDRDNEGLQQHVGKVICNGKKYCPKDCSYKQQKTNSSFPYLWDPSDDLCKSQNPAVLGRYGSTCNCRYTCFTPEAIEDTEAATVWPWKSWTERELYHTNNETEKLQLIIQKSRARMMRKGNFKDYSEYRPRFDCQNATKKLPLHVYAAFQHHLMFVPQAKLIFCGVPKSGITEWIKFFRFIHGARDYLAFPHNKFDTEDFMVGNLSPAKAFELIVDPAWTKAVFFRDPAERLLSAYLDKVVGSGYTQKVFHIGGNGTHKGQENTTILSFEEFVHLVAMPPNFVNGTLKNIPIGHGLHATTDPHWRPQSMMCGLDVLLPHFDFVGNFHFMSQQTRLLLERVGLWDEYGAKFDNAEDGHFKGNNPCVKTPLQKGDIGYNASRICPGFNQKGVTGRHSTDSKAKMEAYYTPDLMEKVRKAYALDYAIFEELQSRAEKKVNDIATGKGLKVVQEHCS
jgi:hypothetical protein